MTLWVTQDRQILEISEMDTRHIFHCVRMLWNHTVPIKYRLLPYRRYRLDMTREYILSRMKALLDELSRRELEDWMIADIRYMRLCYGRYIEQTG